MDEEKYIDMDGMQERVDAAHSDHLNKVWDEVIEKSDKVDTANQAVCELWSKSLQQETDEEENKMIAQMEAEKVQAINEIEEKYKRKNTHFKLDKREDEDLKQMLRNIKYR